MNGIRRIGIPSTAAIAGHPLHHLLITLPIGFLVGTLLMDIAFISSEDAIFDRVCLSLIGGGFITGLLAALTGLIDFFGSERIRSLTIALIHFFGNGLALAITDLLLSLILIFAVAGWLGRELVFRHGAGVVGKIDER